MVEILGNVEVRFPALEMEFLAVGSESVVLSYYVELL